MTAMEHVIRWLTAGHWSGLRQERRGRRMGMLPPKCRRTVRAGGQGAGLPLTVGGLIYVSSIAIQDSDATAMLLGVFGCLIIREDRNHLCRDAKRRCFHAATVDGGQHRVDAFSDDAVLLQIARYTGRGKGEATKHAIVVVPADR